MTSGPPVIIRCDGSSSIGFGHVVRCSALARSFREDHDMAVEFAVRDGPLAVRMLEVQGFTVHLSPSGADQAKWLRKLLKERNAAALVLDIRDNLRREHIVSFKSLGVLIVVVDDGSDRRLAADLAFYPPVPQVSKLDWQDFEGERYVGWEWVLLRPQFAAQPLYRIRQGCPNVLVTMGGSDPQRLTLRVLEALSLLSYEFDVTVLIGPAFDHEKEIEIKAAQCLRPVRLVRKVVDPRPFMLEADIAIASFGVTAYELAATGVPAVHLCLTDDHEASATAFQDAGMAEVLGVHTRLSNQEIADQVALLLQDPVRREQMGQNARGLVDGHGAWRVTLEVVKSLGGSND